MLSMISYAEENGIKKGEKIGEKKGESRLGALMNILLKNKRYADGECCFTLKWFHAIIILVKNFDDRKPFLIVRCNEWGEFLIQRVCVFQRSIIW